MRKKLLAANWKMYKTPDDCRAFVRDFAATQPGAPVYDSAYTAAAATEVLLAAIAAAAGFGHPALAAVFAESVGIFPNLAERALLDIFKRHSRQDVRGVARQNVAIRSFRSCAISSPIKRRSSKRPLRMRTTASAARRERARRRPAARAAILDALL